MTIKKESGYIGVFVSLLKKPFFKILTWQFIIVFQGFAQYPHIHYFINPEEKISMPSTANYTLGQDMDSCVMILKDKTLLRYIGTDFLHYSWQATQPMYQMPKEDFFSTTVALERCWLGTKMKKNLLYYFDRKHILHSIKVRSIDKSSSYLTDHTVVHFQALRHDLLLAYTGNENQLFFFRLNKNKEVEQIPTPKNFYRDFPQIDFNFGNILIDTTARTIGVYEKNQWVKLSYKGGFYFSPNHVKTNGKYLLIALKQSLMDRSSTLVLFDIQQRKEIARKPNVFGTFTQFLADGKILWHNKETIVFDEHLQEVPLPYLPKETLSTVNNIYSDAQKNIWFSNNQNASLGFISQQNIGAQKVWNFKSHLRLLQKDSYGNIWIEQNEGELSYFHKNSLENIKFDKAFQGNLRCMTVNKDELWVLNTSHWQLQRLWIPSVSSKTTNTMVPFKEVSNNEAKNSQISPEKWPFNYYMNLKTGNILVNKNDKIVLSSDQESSILHINSNKTYQLEKIETNSFIFAIDEQGRKWMQKNAKLFVDDKEVRGVPTDWYNTIVIAKDGKVWLGTNGEGLWIYDPITEKSHLLEYTDGKKIKSIVFDKEGAWIAGEDGLTFYDINSKTHFYTLNSGLPTTMVMDLKVDDSTLYIAVNNSFVTLNKAAFLNISPISNLLNYDFAAISGKQLVIPNQKFSYDENYLSIQLKDLSYGVNDDFLFEYHLLHDGKDLLINEGAISESSRIFPSLAPGNYQFYVIKRGPFKQNYGKTAVLQFTILPPFWKTLWFVSLLILAASLLVYIYLRRQRLVEIKINEMEMEALSSQINPHFLGNGMAAIGSIVILEKDPIKAYTYIETFSKMVRQFMESTIRRYISIESETDFLKNYVKIEQLRFSDFELEISNTTPPGTEVPAGILQPLVENAIRHGLLKSNATQKKIKIDFKKEGLCIKCTIDDNGPGINVINASKQKTTHTSVSVNNINRRIELISRSKKYKRASLTITDKSLLGTESGTLIEILFEERKQTKNLVSSFIDRIIHLLSVIKIKK